MDLENFIDLPVILLDNVQLELILFSMNQAIYINLFMSTIVSAQRTSLEHFMPLFRISRTILNQIMDQDIRSETYIRDLAALDKTQSVIDQFVPFPCTTTGFRSKERPGSVDMLMPGDIDVIGAMGDSLTAGVGALSTNLINLFREYRGVSFTIGGQKTWREYLTIPNILKEFNPDLIGYSVNTSITLEYASQFNVAETAAMSGDIYYMAKVLIKRMTKDKRVDINNDWKMISIFIGSNDFCNACFESNPEDLLPRHKEALIKTLRLIRTYLPRTLVNIVTPPHINILGDVTNTDINCEAPHRFLCPCFIGETFNRDRPKLADIITRWQLLDEEIANYDEFNNGNFTVVWQPLFLEPVLPRNSNGEVDLSFFGADCFHFSQKGHATVANTLWNDIMSPVGEKPTTFFSGNIKCPSKEHPYLFTKRNSYVNIRRK